MAGRQTKVPSTPLIDILIGGRVRERRIYLGMTQVELGKRIGVAYQQLQKYERGADRISFSRMLRVAAALDVDLSYFVDGRSPKTASKQTMTRDCLQLVRAYSAIRDKNLKKKALQMVKALAKGA